MSLVSLTIYHAKPSAYQVDLGDMLPSLLIQIAGTSRRGYASTSAKSTSNNPTTDNSKKVKIIVDAFFVFLLLLVFVLASVEESES